MAAKVKVALIGCGGIMNKHAREINDSRDEVECVGLVDVAEENMKRLIERSLGDVEAPPMFAETAKMYQQAKPDAVVIATPHTLHYEQAKEALDHGCHVLMEKPMVTELEHAYDLEKRVKEAGKHFCIAYNTPCTAEFYTLRDMIRKGELGRLVAVNMYLSQNWYRGTLGSWRQKPELSGGGQLYDSGAHALNSLCWTVEADVEEVYAHVDRLDVPVDINGTMTVKFANNTLASVCITGQGPNGSHGTWIFEEGRVDLDPWGGNFLQMFTLPSAGFAPDKVKYPQMRGADRKPFGNFIDAILGRDEPRTTVRNGVIQSQLMDAVYESEKTGQPARPKKA